MKSGGRFIVCFRYLGIGFVEGGKGDEWRGVEWSGAVKS